MRLAVVIPTCDRPQMLRDCLLSVRTQTLQPAEVIVVDDGSDPDTAAICHSIFPDALVLYSGRSGIAAANNLGIDHVTADAIVALGDDDLMLPNRLADQARVLAEGASVAYSGWINFSADGRLELVTGHGRPTIDVLLRESAVAAQGAAAYLTSVMKHYRYDPRLSAGCDMELNARLLAHGETFEHTLSFTLLRRLHEGSVTSRQVEVQRAVKDALRARYLAPVDEAPPPEPYGDDGRRIEIDWPVLSTALAGAGIDLSRLVVGRAAGTLDEVADHILRANVAETELAVLAAPAPGRLGGGIVALGPPEATPVLAFREKLLAIPDPRRVAVPRAEATLAGLSSALGLDADGARLLADVDGLSVDQMRALASALAVISSQWRFMGPHAFVDAAFEREMPLAAISTRFGDPARA